MANTYDVGDRVKISIAPPSINPQPATEQMYAATVITYVDNGDNTYTYRLSVDGLGDTITITD